MFTQNRQFRKKTVKEFSDDGTSVTYTQQQFYEFDGKASQPLVESDRIVALNMQMNVRTYAISLILNLNY